MFRCTISGIVTVDPPYNQSLISNPPPPKPDRDTLFTDEEKRKQLDKLLKSRNPEDLQVRYAPSLTLLLDDFKSQLMFLIGCFAKISGVQQCNMI